MPREISGPQSTAESTLGGGYLTEKAIFVRENTPSMLGLHYWDLVILIVYFGIVAYLGLILGRKKTKTLGDFLIAGGSWGAAVTFLFNFSSALAGAEAVVVSAAAYRSGLSGIWYWWSMLFATPMYFLFSVIYKRARVFNMAEFFELRFGSGAATLYSFFGVLICVNFIGIFETGGGKVLAAVTGLPTDTAILICCTVVALYVASGGAMSSLLTDLFQGILCLAILSFGLLPFLWDAAGGLAALRELPATTWALQSADIPWTYILALLFSGAIGSVVAPNILTWIAIAKDEKTGTQCGWAHLWKRVITIFFALYGILFAIYHPGLQDPELAWGTIMKTLLPVGVLGLLVAAFAAAPDVLRRHLCQHYFGIGGRLLVSKAIFPAPTAKFLFSKRPAVGLRSRLSRLRNHSISFQYCGVHRTELVFDLFHLGTAILRLDLEKNQSNRTVGSDSDRFNHLDFAQVFGDFLRSDGFHTDSAQRIGNLGDQRTDQTRGRESIKALLLCFGYSRGPGITIGGSGYHLAGHGRVFSSNATGCIRG